MNQIFDFFKDHAFLSKLLIFLIITAVGVIAVKLILIPVKKILLKAKVDHTVKTFTFSFVKIALYTIVVLIALTNVGVEINSIITAIGAATVAASLALQNTLSNFVSGVILLMTKPFTAGDLIEFGSFEGYVESIRIFFTTIRTFDNKMVKIPNSKLTADSVVNCSIGELRRIKNVFSISYDDNITKVRSVILDVVSKNDLILTDPEPKVYVSNHLDSGIEITVFTWGKQENYFSILFYMEEQVKNAFDKNDINIPYPHVVVKK